MTVSVQQVKTSSDRRRSPASRPDFGGGVAPRSVRAAASCQVSVPAKPASSWRLRLKVGAVMALAVVGLGASAAEFASWADPDPAVQYVQGDPAWAHVDGGAAGR